MSWYRPSGSCAADGADVLVTPDSAGWQFSGLRVLTLTGAPVTIDLGEEEAVMVPLSARDIVVELDSTTFTLVGRDGVFAAVTDWLYIPRDSRITVRGAAGEIAICTARARVRLVPVYTPSRAVPVEVRGGGRASRQVTNIATPDSFDGADRINVCEVITPGGNWSSWPPHRHDGLGDCPYTNEEIYYFRMGTAQSPHGAPAAHGLFHVYTVDERVDETVTIRDGDIYLVPEGYHGPSVAPPEYPMYFLNVLAGPGETRTMAFCDDPDHHWIRESWAGQPEDTRLPWTDANGRTPQSLVPLGGTS
jgi:5-deoxy-glucuronate isomerase